MSIPKKSVRFAQFIDELKAARHATDRHDAVALMKEVMKKVEDSHGLPNDFDLRMNVFSLEESMGWKDLHSDPCYWDDAASRTHRTEVYNNGRIVITRLKQPTGLVLSKP